VGEPGRRPEPPLEQPGLGGKPPALHGEKAESPRPIVDRRAVFKKAREQKVKALMEGNDLAGALTEWKILLAVDPGNSEYEKQFASVKGLIEKRVDQLLKTADNAAASGKKHAEKNALLQALALDPRNSEPMRRLREIEAERAMTVQLAKLKRMTDKRAATAAKLNNKPSSDKNEKKSAKKRPESQNQDSDYLQTGIELFKAGDYESGAVEIKKYLDVHPEDEEAKSYISKAYQASAKTLSGKGLDEQAVEKLEEAWQYSPKPNAELEKEIKDRKSALAQKLYEDGMRVQNENLSEAIALWEQCLKYDPDNVQAKIRLKAAYKMQKNLQALEASP